MNKNKLNIIYLAILGILMPNITFGFSGGGEAFEAAIKIYQFFALFVILSLIAITLVLTFRTVRNKTVGKGDKNYPLGIYALFLSLVEFIMYLITPLSFLSIYIHALISLVIILLLVFSFLKKLNLSQKIASVFALFIWFYLIFNLYKTILVKGILL